MKIRNELKSTRHRNVMVDEKKEAQYAVRIELLSK